MKGWRMSRKIIIGLLMSLISGIALAHAETWTLNSDVLNMSIDKFGGFSVRDKRTGRIWKSSADKKMSNSGFRLVTCDGTRFKAKHSGIGMDFSCRIDRAEVEFCISFERLPEEGVVFPASFQMSSGDALVAPLNGEGFRIPFGIACPLSEKRAMWSSAMAMPFFGVTDELDETGWMIIVETPEDAALQLGKCDGNLESATVSWFGECGKPGYPRRFRIAFFDKGGYVAMAKRYRAYAKETGLLATFGEKTKSRPMVGRLPGAANIWYFPSPGDPSHSKVATELRKAGIGRFLWSSAAPVKDVRAIAKMPDVLIGRYDVCRDVYYPELLDALGWKRPLKNEICRNTSAWPNDIIWTRPESNSWRRAWAVTCKDGRKRNCAAQCDIPAVARLARNVESELAEMPFTSRFMDVVTAIGWEECFNPAHPMTRRVSKKAKMDLLKMLGNRFRLVVGSEQGMDAAVPYCDYFEGMLSPSFARMPHGKSGYGRRQIFRETDEVANRLSDKELAVINEFGLNEKLRIPLFELVYHDCICSHWYWYDYSNRPICFWKKRDCFNALYGTAPMYVFDYSHWREHREEFIRSWRTVGGIARKTGFSEMVSHRVLNRERSVQETQFADGTVVTVDFSTEKISVDLNEN
jgi:hypothetical protein